MKIYVAHSSSFDFKTELYTPLKNTSLFTEHTFFLPHDTDEFINTKEIIESSDLVLAEVSYPSTGEGIELGWADSAGVKIVCIYKEGTTPSSSLKAVSTSLIAYRDSEDLLIKIKEAINYDR